jgi:hypothetical protein
LGEFSPIGRLFSLGSFSKKYGTSPNFRTIFSQSTNYVFISFEQKMGWATFWANFSQTHRVTLPCRRHKKFPPETGSFCRLPFGRKRRVQIIKTLITGKKSRRISWSE